MVTAWEKFWTLAEVQVGQAIYPAQRIYLLSGKKDMEAYRLLFTTRRDTHQISEAGQLQLVSAVL